MEIAAAALQFTTVAVNSFRACILAIEFFSTAQHMGADGDLFRTGLEFEKYRLLTWAEKVGLLGDNERQTLNWQLAGIILKQLESFLTSAATLKGRYSLDVTEEEVQAAEEAQHALAPKQGIAKLIARLKPNLRTTAGQIIQEHNSPIKRIRWAARDRGKLKTFLAEISGLIGKLEFLLDSTERQQEKEEYDRLLREVISLATTTAEAGQIKDFLEDHQKRSERSINAAAYLKQVRLVLGADKRDDEITPKMASDTIGLKMPKLSILGRSLKPWNGAPLFEQSLEFATYRTKQVLIQWKMVDSTQWERYTKQMKCLAVFLMSLSDRSFRSLPCMGYYPYQAQSRHGIVYSMPETDDTEGTDWDLRTLRDLMKDQTFVSLKRRIELARALAETVLQLHTAGWLHKSLRSENIIFLAPRGSSDKFFLNSEPYVFGYEYARSDNGDAALAFTQLPDTELEADLYRHPAARGMGRETFQKRFDLYAMACVIVELVFWKPLVEVFAVYVTENLKELISIAQSQNEVIELPDLKELFEKEEVAKVFRYHAGDVLLDVVKLCFEAPKAKEGDEGLLSEQTTVVERLGWCKV
ncbi:prion-inhibition and propagation-domain-containing protein [Podospora australis]|uniref:Prion-inhibition and propagation-domain-containing protein n=1 Tax=Podospora australis TaxID=1536484 RepID=A0AAN6WIV8_9PEZI|nr:prion-inhibition and propagation-domain-containing protein [Podospora australis]